MLKYLLDTNIAIYIIKKRPIEVLDKFNKLHGRMAISTITLAELIHGTEKSQHIAKNMAVVEDFSSRLITVPYTATAAYHYGNIRAVLELAGQIIGVNDLHIAAQARSQGLVLVSNNQREFQRVPGLLLENWVT